LPDYFLPFQQQFQGIAKFNIESQVQHYASLTVRPEFSEASQSHILRPEALTRFINNGEWNLASVVSPYPSINFILYIPSAETRPMHIHDSDNEPVPSNAFLIPRWGGVLIHNPDKNAQVLTADDLHEAMETFVAQLRSLIGLKAVQEFHPRVRNRS